MKLFHTIKTKLGAFWSEDSGSIAVESALAVPTLTWAILGTLTFFDAYRNEAITFKAGQTVADMISREADAINDEYIDGARELLIFLSINDPEPDVRITAFRYDADQDDYVVVWSKERGPRAPLETAELANMTNRLPVMSNEERAIMVETWTDYQAPWDVGLNNYSLQTYNVISPRFVTQICFSNTPENADTLEC